MRTGSALKRYCAYPEVLDRIPPATAAERTRQANKEASADRGTRFHKATQVWIERGGKTWPTDDDAEIQGLCDVLSSVWYPPKGCEAEVAWGLSTDGDYIEVKESEPHVYVPDGYKDGFPGMLLTAGRADICWEADGVLRCIDLKAGKWPVDPARTNLQVNAAGMALALRAFAKTYIPGVYYARDGAFDWGQPVDIGSQEHREMFAEVKAAALLDEKPHPGSHCGKCWSRAKCPSAAKEDRP